MQSHDTIIPVSTHTSIAQLSDAVRMLAEVKTVQDARGLISMAEAARVYAQQAKLGIEAQNHAAEIKLRAERKAGELLAAMEKQHGGTARALDSRASSPVLLADMGISHNQSSRWQTEATVPEAVFERHVTDTKASGDELTSASVVRLAQKAERETRPANTAALPQGRYRCIVIDPPWPVEKILRDVRPNQHVFDYPTMTLDAIAALEILDLADPAGCHVYLWTTHKFLPYAFTMFATWNVRYECLMTWVKPVGFTPFSWMYNTEHVLFGRIGSLPVERKGLKLAFSAPVTRHSEKPDLFYDLVSQASPEPRIELFQREPHLGFTGWGNESHE